MGDIVRTNTVRTPSVAPGVELTQTWPIERLLNSTDIRFPTSPQIAAEKLCGWSALVDLFHGALHVTDVTIRKFVIEVGPALHRLFDQCPGDPVSAMDLVCRVLFEAQQEHFAWCGTTATKATGAGPVLNLDPILFKASNNHHKNKNKIITI